MTVHEDAGRLMDLVFGFVKAQVVHTMVTLDIAEHLVEAPTTSAGLAERIHCHEPSLRRLLRGAAYLELVTVDADERYTVTRLGQLLCQDAPLSMKYMAKALIGQPMWAACGRLDHTVRTGQAATEHVLGQSAYAWLADHAEEQETLYSWVVESARSDVPRIVDSLDLSGVTSFVDVAGGNGILATALLMAYPRLTGTIFDLATALKNTHPLLAKAGVADRCSLVAGDFLTDPIPAGHDVYLAKGVLSDWAGAAIVHVLRNCRRAMSSDSRLLLVDLIMPAGGTSDPLAVLSDLCTLPCGGAIRTEAELRELLATAGLRLVAVTGDQSRTGTSVLHVVKD